MSTPRKPYFRVTNEINRLPWPRDVKTSFMLLSGLLVDRWARDRLDASEAERHTLSQGAMNDVTGRAQLTHSRRALRVLAECIQSARGEYGSLSIREQGEFTEIYWDKFAEIQELDSERRGRTRRTQALQTPESAPAPAPALKDPSVVSPLELEPTPAAEAEREKKARASRAPEDLTAEQHKALRIWCEESMPSELPHLRAHVEACLDHFRGNGGLKSDWVATCRNWIRRAPQMRRPGAPVPITSAPRKLTHEELIEKAKRLREIERDRRAHGEI